MIDPFSFKTRPFGHQAEELRLWAEHPRRAKFWEMGTGKTKDGVDVTAHARRQRKIDACIIVAPSGVERNWVTDELPAHMPEDVPYLAHVWSTGSSGTKWHRAAVADLHKCDRALPVLAMTYDAWLTDAGKQAAWDLIRERRTICHFDETGSTLTKWSQRTQSIVRAAPLAAMTRIYSGSPVDGSPFDVYWQVMVVDPTFWRRELRISTLADFKAFFGIFRYENRKPTNEERAAGEEGRRFPILVTYQNVAVLRDLLKKVGTRVLKKDVLDLPEKLYTRRYYEMCPAQRRVYDLLEKEYMADFPGDDEAMVTAELPIVRMTRLQQVLCGYVPADGDEEPRELIDAAHNPRADATVEFVGEAGNQQTVVWAQYRLDIDILMGRLRAEGRTPVRYDGAVGEDERARNKRAFQAGDASDFVANTSVGAEGLTFVNAHTHAFHNNTYRMIKRKQAEDRSHRIGQRHACLYGDMVCPGTRDERAIHIMQRKHRTSEAILGDAPTEWL